MTIGLFTFLILIGIFVCIWLKVRRWILRQEKFENVRESLMNDVDIIKMFEDYEDFCHKYPEFEKMKKKLNLYMKGKK